MTEVLKDICLTMIRQYGIMTSILFTFIIVVILVSAEKNLKTLLKSLFFRKPNLQKLFSKRGEQQLKIFEELFFCRLNYLFDVRIHQINCPCPLRESLYKRIFGIKIQIFSKALRTFVKQCQKQYDKQYYKQKLKIFFSQKHLQWKHKCIQEGVPKFVVDAVDEKIQSLRNMYYINLQRIFANNYLYSSNRQRMIAVLEMFLTLQENILNVCEEVLDSFNGQIKNLEFEKVTCKNCEVCIHDEFLKKNNLK